MKHCSTCGMEKALSEFNRQSSSLSGYRARCKACQSKDNRERYARKGDHIRATAKAYAVANVNKVATARIYYYYFNRVDILEKQRGYVARNYATIYARQRRYVKANPEKEKQYGRRYRMANLHMGRARVAKRNAAKLKATPPWADPTKIASFYESADALCMLTGEWYHVDHMVPLQGDTVCGLHNEFNLQILTAFANVSKGNRHWPDQP